MSVELQKGSGDLRR